MKRQNKNKIVQKITFPETQYQSRTDLIKKANNVREYLNTIDEQIKKIDEEKHFNFLSKFLGKCYSRGGHGPGDIYFRAEKIENRNLIGTEIWVWKSPNNKKEISQIQFSQHHYLHEGHEDVKTWKKILNAKFDKLLEDSKKLIKRSNEIIKI